MPRKILIVDDEPHMLRVTELSLKKGGYDLVIGRNGREALELAAREKPDLIVMDVNMPELDGLSALQQLKASPVKAILPLFIMVDAMGWEILRQDPFGQSFAPTRKRLDSVFGYSSTCVPSILSGRWPDEHRNWCYFVYDPKHSPFRSLRRCAGCPPPSPAAASSAAGSPSSSRCSSSSAATSTSTTSRSATSTSSTSPRRRARSSPRA
jgi:CheY-like chemotaxis protein